MYDFIVVGGGAAGFFAAINIARLKPDWKIAIIEKQGKVLQKVKVSGGGRCNVTNIISDPEKLSQYYPRGGEFLKAGFEKFSSNHTREWFSERGIRLKTEKDGRVFPVSDHSQTVIDCFLREAKSVEIILKERVEDFQLTSDNIWEINTHTGMKLEARYLMIASGSDKRIWQQLSKLNLTISPEVPSLFTFNIDDSALHQLQGTSFENATVSIQNADLKQSGSLLITHWGLSGPVILKLSAWGAYKLNELEYNFKISVNWISNKSEKEIETHMVTLFKESPKKNIRSMAMFELSHRFWNYICDCSEIGEFQKGAETGKKQIKTLLQNLTSYQTEVVGKSTFKEEFVTAGGIELSEVEELTFLSKKYKNLYFGGEVLNIDGLTGGFNFQAAWTSGFLIGKNLSKRA